MMARLLCLVTGHRWSRASYPAADMPDGYFLRCRRCGKEKETPDRAHWASYGG